MLMKRLEEDPAFAENDDIQSMTVEMKRAKTFELESQQALRQARGFSVYLKGKQDSPRKIEVKRQSSFRKSQEEQLF